MPPGYGVPPGYGAAPGALPPTGIIQAQLQFFIRNAQGVITKPSVAAFDAIQQYANWNILLVALGAAALVRGVLVAISSAYTSALFFNSLGTNTVTYGVGTAIGTFITTAIGTFIGFFIGAGILWLIARAFQGTGSFLNYAHALGIVYLPLYVIAAAFGLIPILGGLAALAIAVYAIYLAVLATASTHRLTMGKSVAVVLIPVGVGILLGICVAAVAAAALIALSHR